MVTTHLSRKSGLAIFQPLHSRDARVTIGPLSSRVMARGERFFATIFMTALSLIENVHREGRQSWKCTE